MVWRSVSVTTAQVVMEEHQSVKVRELYTAVGLMIKKDNKNKQFCDGCHSDWKAVK